MRLHCVSVVACRVFSSSNHARAVERDRLDTSEPTPAASTSAHDNDLRRVLCVGQGAAGAECRPPHCAAVEDRHGDSSFESGRMTERAEGDESLAKRAI